MIGVLAAALLSACVPRSVREAQEVVAQAIVVNGSTGSVVVNQPFTTSITRQIPNAGVYILRIQTTNGALVGQFVVQ